MPHLGCIEMHDSVFRSVQSDADFVVIPDVLNGAKVTVCNLQVSIRSRKLYFVPDSKLPLDLAICGNTVQPRRVIRDLLAVLFLDGEKILFRVQSVIRKSAP
jgi:hypothetical protein